ncbi:MAG: fused MFS/spermidine synthase [Verrucomicrobiales bacterium]|nr:fused MFS/spermidine synthase [Verrucomicrobiales bacterium]
MPLFITAIFLSAFLLFQVQPIIARYILPWYGGSPAVWTTCMLFFQLGLLGGYAYAHVLASSFREKPKMQLWIHLGVVVLALVFMPITPSESLRPVGGGDTSDVWGIVKLLALTVGLPYVAISASGPLLQHWFAGAHPGKSPYRLYAVSNFGSLLGLLSYPFLFEPMMGLKSQTWWWSGGFVIYGALAIACAWRYARADPEPKFDGEIPKPADNDKAGTGRKILWVLFSACGSAGMLAITNQMCQDVAVVPFLWVLPLGLYLTTFIICFDREAWYHRAVWVPLAVIGVAALVLLINQQTLDSGSTDHFVWKTAGKIRHIFAGDGVAINDEFHLYWQIAFFLFALFTLCMVCHGEMVRLKPSSRYLTSFYLLISLGGALGGAFVSLVAPRLFNGYWELHIIILLVTLLVGFVISFDGFRRYKAPVWGGLGLIATLQVFAIFALGLRSHYLETKEDAIASLRSFHGVVHVYESLKGTEDHYLAMYHGRITHGRQYQSEKFRNIPTTYYSENSGVGALLQSVPQRQPETRGPLNMGVIGLGSGSLAVHAEAGDSMVFYEINPQVEQLAKSHFTYLADCKGDASVILGDARTSLEQELARGEPRNLDILFVDAFSGDSIPVHLVTEEAFAIYFQHIKEDGFLVTHITNLHIDLSDPVRQLADKFGREALLVIHNPDYEVYHLYYSEWVIITKNEEVIKRLRDGGWVNEWVRKEPKPIHWTDDYSNLFQVIMFEGE